MPTSNDIRTAFLDYFDRRDHEVVASGPLVPHNDPSLLFTNAGMVQFKNVFTGAETRDIPRAATSQKCVRAGGKHNDLDNVGHTARHHTFFEMLGNFSFGDYFKDVAIELSWDLITKQFEVSPDRLLITVYGEDEEAAALWRKISGLPESRIIPISTSDNFWSMGATGPCGPCSEIFFDHGEDIPGGPPGSPDQDGDRFVEIWNLVFMQYERLADGERIDLPHPSIDTGMGLERIAAVMQGVHDNYDTDLFKSLINASVEETGKPARGEAAVSHRVIADHLRSSCFLMADGVLPSNEGRGYVLRRIMRRAMRHAHMLGTTEPLMCRLVPSLIREMGLAYPELVRAQALMGETLKHEETRFQTTLAKGMRLLNDETKGLGAGQALSGDVAFKLYDTYGFPLDLTQDVLKGQDKTVDLDGFNVCMERQREEARAAWSGSGEAATDAIWFSIFERSGATEFLGYEVDLAEGEVVALIIDGDEVDTAAAGATVALVVNQTPFYGESGGQMGDAGVVRSLGAATAPLKIEITDTRKYLGSLHVHMGKILEGQISLGDDVEMEIDPQRRASLRANHSATHLLHAALRNGLGDHVTQKGSLVAPDRLRFDISHPKAISLEEIRVAEAEVNKHIRENAEVATRQMTPEEAIEKGAMALFGEKYGDEVRVVSMCREEAGAHDQAAPFSLELCGGTHVGRTGDIGTFKIVGESAVAAGVRRIEALTGAAAEAYMSQTEDTLHGAAATLKAAPADVGARISSLMEEKKRLEREISDIRRQMATGMAGGMAGGMSSGGSGGGGDGIEDVNGVSYAARNLSGVPPKELKPMADDLMKKIDSGVVALVGEFEGKAALVVAVSGDLETRFNAVDLVRLGVEKLGGQGGGGRSDMAQGGGNDPSGAEAALKVIEAALGS